MLLRHALGSVLRRIRTEQGTTLRQLSETSSVSIPYLSEIERGRKEASSEILAALCRVLEVSEGELFVRVAAEFAPARAEGTAQVLSLVPERDANEVTETSLGGESEKTPAALLLVA